MNYYLMHRSGTREIVRSDLDIMAIIGRRDKAIPRPDELEVDMFHCGKKLGGVWLKTVVMRYHIGALSAISKNDVNKVTSEMQELYERKPKPKAGLPVSG